MKVMIVGVLWSLPLIIRYIRWKTTLSILWMAVYCANMPNFGRMRDGLRIIYGSAFVNNEFQRFVTISETVDSIGSRAFVGTVMSYPAGAGSLPVFRCKATVSPKMGAGAFNSDEYVFCYTVYVPDESVGLYRAADGWKDIMTIKGFSQIVLGIEDAQVSKALDVTHNCHSYLVSASRLMAKITFFYVSGQQLHSQTVTGSKAEILMPHLSAPVTIVRVNYATDK